MEVRLLKLWAVHCERDYINNTYTVTSVTPWGGGPTGPHGAWVISAVDELDAFKRFNQWQEKEKDT